MQSLTYEIFLFLKTLKIIVSLLKENLSSIGPDDLF